ncbi:MAG: hypothetical protein ABFD80_08120 [Acidobacteriota bacterium]
MKLSSEDRRRLRRAIRLTQQIQAHFFRENGVVSEIRPKRGGHSFRKKRSYLDV